MNRVIKFRAWLKTHEKMLPMEGMEIRNAIEMNNRGSEAVFLMQFTGLADRNGKEIYEGDILNWDYCGTTEYQEWMKNPAYIVCYEDGYKLCGKGIHKNQYKPDGLYLHGFRFKHTEIIGNIYKNPELIAARALLTTSPTLIDQPEEPIKPPKPPGDYPVA